MNISKINRPFDKLKQNNILYFVLLAIVAITAVVVRVYQFGEFPGGINQDEAMAAVDAKALLDYGTDRFGTLFPVHFKAQGISQMSVLLSYVMVPFIKVFGYNIVAIRLPLLITSLIALYIAFRFAYKAFDRWIALTVLFVLALSPWHIMQSRWSLDCNLFPHFLLFACYALYLSADKKRYLYIAAALFGISMYAYAIAIYTVPFMLLAFSFYYIKYKYATFKQIVICAVIFLAISWPFILCMFINALELDTIYLPFMTIERFYDSVRSSDILFFSDDIWATLIDNIKYTFYMVIAQYHDAPFSSIEGFGRFYPFTTIFMFIGIYYLIKKCRKNKALVILAIWGIVGIVSGLITYKVNVNRINIFWYPMAFFIAFGIYMLVKHIKPLSVVVVAVFVIYFVNFNSYYFDKHKHLVNEVFFADFTDVLQVAKSNKFAEKFYITTHIWEKVDDIQTVEVITMFYFDIDSKYFMGQPTDKPGYDDVLPYDEKFNYIDMMLLPAEGPLSSRSAYIVTNFEYDHVYRELCTYNNYQGYSIIKTAY